MRIRGDAVGRLVHLALAVVIAAIAVSFSAGPAVATAATVDRHAGADRYATAAAISAATFASGVQVAFVATGTDFPDSLAGGSPAGRLKAPILLTPRGDLPTATRAELVRLAPRSDRKSVV